MAALALQEGAQDYLIKGEIESRGFVRALRYAIERKAMEEALFVERERAQVTLNSIGDAVISTDIPGNVTFLNVVAEKMTGWTWKQALGKPLAEVFQILDGAYREAIPDPTRVVVAENRIEHIPADCILVRRDGFEIPIEDSVSPIQDREGRATGAVIVFRDVSAAKAMALQMATPRTTIFLPGSPIACSSTIA